MYIMSLCFFFFAFFLCLMNLAPLVVVVDAYPIKVKSVDEFGRKAFEGVELQFPPCSTAEKCYGVETKEKLVAVPVKGKKKKEKPKPEQTLENCIPLYSACYVALKKEPLKPVCVTKGGARGTAGCPASNPTETLLSPAEGCTIGKGKNTGKYVLCKPALDPGFITPIDVMTKKDARGFDPFAKEAANKLVNCEPFPTDPEPETACYNGFFDWVWPLTDQYKKCCDNRWKGKHGDGAATPFNKARKWDGRFLVARTKLGSRQTMLPDFHCYCGAPGAAPDEKHAHMIDFGDDLADNENTASHSHSRLATEAESLFDLGFNSGWNAGVRINTRTDTNMNTNTNPNTNARKDLHLKSGKHKNARLLSGRRYRRQQ